MSFHRWLSNRVDRLLSQASRPKTPDVRRVFRPALEALGDRCLPSAGVLDPTFGNGAGYVATSVGNYGSGAEAVLIQPDGKILAAGTADLGTGDAAPPEVFTVVRYQADGSFDTSFGTGGHAFADFPGAAFHGWRYSNAYAAALYPQSGTANDGKIVLAGEHDTKNGATFALARFNANGTLDNTFGTDRKNPGEVTTTFAANSYQAAFGVVIQTEGKIVAAGASSSGLVLARYKTDGTLDKTFGTGGEVITSSLGVALSAGTLLLQPNGKLLVVGETHPAAQTWVMTMVRYNSDGSLDTSFGVGGLVTSSVVVNNGGVNAALYPPGTPNAGEIAVVGQTTNPGQNVEIARFTANGALDTTFGSGGTVTGQLGSHPSVVIAADGKLVVSFGSETSINGSHQFGMARYNTDGSPDSTFGTNGFVRSQLAGYSASDPGTVALQSNGDIVAVGQVYFTGYNSYYPNGFGSSNIAVVRYLPSEPQIGSFAASPNPVPAAGAVTLTVANVADLNPGSTITQIDFYMDNNGDGVLEPGTDTLLGYAAQSNGAWTLTFSPSTFGLTSGHSYTVFARAEDSYGVFGDPAALALTVQ